jgi:hypothetical protein
MKSLVELSNGAQYKVALQGMERYRAMIQSADTDSRRYTGRVLADLEKVIERVKGERGYGTAATRLRQLHSQLEGVATSSAGRLQEDKRIEIIINQYNGFTDLLLPVKNEDLGEETENLAQKLYDSIRGVCEDLEGDPEFTEASVEGYVVFSLAGETNKKNLAKALLDSAPAEYGGEAAKSVLYLRVAPNFSFNYERDKVVGVPVEPSSKKTDLTKEEAVEWFEKGKRAVELSKMFPNTPKMTLAGWMSAWSKGAYKKRGKN